MTQFGNIFFLAHLHIHNARYVTFNYFDIVVLFASCLLLMPPLLHIFIKVSHKSNQRRKNYDFAALMLFLSRGFRFLLSTTPSLAERVSAMAVAALKQLRANQISLEMVVTTLY